MLLATKVEKEIDSRLSEVFGAHREILNDLTLKEELRKEIVNNLVCASSAVKQVFLRWETRFLLMESQIAREKGDDIHDISIRLRNALAGITVHPLESIPENCVLVTTRLLPSDTIFLSGRATAAVLLEHGTTGSHAALFARQMGIPCISGIANVLNIMPKDTTALVDADLGVVTVNPTTKLKTKFRKKIETKRENMRLAKAMASKVAVTPKGISINVYANIGCKEDTDAAMLNGADGIGLFRLEQIYLGRSTPPDVNELEADMREILQPARGRKVGIRLLDIGADKPLPFIGFLAESNPALGCRGIRFLRQYPELLDTQLRAIIALMDDFDIQILVPMVALPEDIVIVKDKLDSLCKLLNVSSPPSLGAMIETPACALSAKLFAPHVTFMSFGTNDLTQYVFAADRENAAVENYYDDASDVIFRLINIVHNDLPDMPLSICGELAGREEYVSRLLASGISALSIAAPLIPAIKSAIRSGLSIS